MNMFEEIDKQKQELPKLKTLNKQLSKYDFNMYQKFGMFIFIVAIIMGIILGNIFSTCGATSSFYDTACVTKQFNLSYMIGTWLFGLMISLMFFGMGHMIYLLDDIADNIEKITTKK